MRPDLARLARLVLLVVIATASPAGAAGVYKWVGADGTITYSDRPQPVPEPAAPSEASPPAAGDKASATKPAPGPRPASATVDEVLELSALRPQLATTPARLAAEFRPRRGRLNAGDTATLEQIMARHFDADRLYTQVRTEFGKRADGKRLAEVAQWLRSPLGQKITALEIAAGVETDHGRRMHAYAPGGRGGPPATRVALVERIDWVAGITDGSLEAMLAVARAMAMAVNRALPADERQTTAQIERQIQELRGQARAKLAHATITSMLYQYRSLDDEELQRYADFLSGDAGRWYSATMSKARNRTVSIAVQRAAGEVIRAIPPERWSGGVSASPRH